MKQQLNEIKRMQQLAGIDSEDLESDIRGDLEKVSGIALPDLTFTAKILLKKGKIKPITPETKLKVGDWILLGRGMDWEAQIIKISGNQYTLDYGEAGKGRRPRTQLENFWFLIK